MGETKTLQNKILEIAVDFDKYCQEHEITYFLMGGSALGAMRHKGFIPWDDDLDVFMTYDNYLKLIDCASKDLNTDKYYFEKEDTKIYPYFFSKLKMNGTTLIENDHTSPEVHQGIFIDIMCLNYVSENSFIRKLQFYVAGMLKAKANKLNHYVAKGTKKKIEIFISNIVVNKLTKKMFLNFVRKDNKKKTRILAHYFGRAKYGNSCYKAEWFEKQVYVDFEDTKLPVCNGVHEYLMARYGEDYMKMPSEETKAMYDSHAVYYSVDTDYKEYYKNKQ